MIGFYSRWPAFICVALVLWLVSTPVFKPADTPPSPRLGRIVTMDGMRGFLALAVVLHHVAIYHQFLVDGVWTWPPSHFFMALGPVGVALFFMITAFLFWSQLIRAGGRPSWFSLYTGRVFRIGPLYLAAVAVMLTVVAVQTGFAMRVPALSLVKELIRWFSLGLLSPADVNQYHRTALLLAEVTWTLQWEWYFYLSLPLLALFARKEGMHLPFVLTAIAACQVYLHLFRTYPGKRALAFVMLFLLGMLCASLRETSRLARLSDRAGSTLLIALLVVAFQFEYPSVSTLPQLMLGAVLYLAISGVSAFGLLKTRPALRMGDVSYGIYLLQGLALAAVFRTSFARSYDLASPLAHWLFGLAAVVLLVVTATATHLWIERPGIKLGKAVIRRVTSKRRDTFAASNSA